MSAPETLSPVQTPEMPKPLRKKRRSGPSGPRWLRKFRKRFSWLTLQFVVIFIVAVVAVVLAGGAAVAVDASARVQSSITSLNRVMNSLNSKTGTDLTFADFSRLRASTAELNSTLGTARRQTQFLRPFVSMNAELASNMATLDIAQRLATSADDMLSGLEPTLFFMVGGSETDTVVSQISSGERIVELLGIGRGRFIEASGELQSARSELDSLSPAVLTAKMLLTLQTLESYYTQLHEINEVLLNAPNLLTTAMGLEGEQSYLVLAQNSDELRPSGGYISSYGWLRVRSGRIVNYDYSATTINSPNPPDESIENPFSLPSWWIQFPQPYASWDGSWYVDFPSTAEMAKWYYDNGNNPQAPIDAVIGIDIIGFENILAALGDVRIPTYNVAINTANFREVVYDIRALGEEPLAHKRFLTEVYRQIFAQWQSVEDADKNGALLGALLKSLQEKHVMLYFADETMNDAVGILGWAGDQYQGSDSDYLLIADTNLGNKSNRSVIRQVTYDVEVLEDGSLSSRSTIGYDYPDSLASQDPAVNPAYHGPIDYRNLLQVFTPLGSTLTDPSQLGIPVQTVEASGHSAFVTAFTLEYDTAVRLQFAYTTPPIVEDLGPYKRYRLLLQKQPGTLGDPVSVQITLPPDTSVVSTSPEPIASYSLDNPILEFRTNLTTDQWIEVIYR
jgi:hypothetical protein